MRLLWVLLVGLLSACTITLEGVTLSYRLDLTPAILRFEPTGGRGPATSWGRRSASSSPWAVRAG
jgi:hypothetical protein